MRTTTAQDRADGAVFLKNAADTGDPRSNHVLGIQALVAGRHEIAFPRFRTAAYSGYKPSQVFAACYLLHHPRIDTYDWSKIPYNEIEAINLVQKSRDWPGSQLIMGHVHEHGLGGFPANLTKARELYQLVYNSHRKYFEHQTASNFFLQFRIAREHLTFAEKNYKP